MNVHGIYETSANMHTFESRGEFQSYLQQEAGVSGSYFGFYAGAKKAWGSSVSAAQQQYMSVLDVDVDRWGDDHIRWRTCAPHNPSLFYTNHLKQPLFDHSSCAELFKFSDYSLTFPLLKSVKFPWPNKYDMLDIVTASSLPLQLISFQRFSPFFFAKDWTSLRS